MFMQKQWVLPFPDKYAKQFPHLETPGNMLVLVLVSNFVTLNSSPSWTAVQIDTALLKQCTNPYPKFYRWQAWKIILVPSASRKAGEETMQLLSLGILMVFLDSRSQTKMALWVFPGQLSPQSWTNSVAPSPSLKQLLVFSGSTLATYTHLFPEMLSFADPNIWSWQRSLCSFSSTNHPSHVPFTSILAGFSSYFNVLVPRLSLINPLVLAFSGTQSFLKVFLELVVGLVLLQSNWKNLPKDLRASG